MIDATGENPTLSSLVFLNKQVRPLRMAEVGFFADRWSGCKDVEAIRRHMVADGIVTLGRIGIARDCVGKKRYLPFLVIQRTAARILICGNQRAACQNVRCQTKALIADQRFLIHFFQNRFLQNAKSFRRSVTSVSKYDSSRSAKLSSVTFRTGLVVASLASPCSL